jgi:hypothetical protein
MESFDTSWKLNHYLGKRKDSRHSVRIIAPKWQCEWYWSFGWLETSNEHYHLDGYQNGRNINMYDALKFDYVLNENIDKNLYLFCELSLTAYSLKKTAEVLGRGGSHMCTNPLSELIKNSKEVDRINKIILPAVFNKLNLLILGKLNEV